MTRPRRITSVLTSLPARILVSAGLLALVALQIEWQQVGDGLANAAWGWFVLATGIYLASFTLAAARWHLLLQAAELHVSWRQAFRAYLIGMFSNNLLPSGYGGDAVRAWVVAGTGRPLARSLVSVVTDRVSALVCLLALAWIVVAVKVQAIPSGIVILLAIATGLGAAAGLTGLLIARREGLGRFLPDAVRPWTGEVATVIRRYEHDRRLLAAVFAIGLVYQAIVLGAFWLIAEALGLGIGPWVLAVVVPPVLLASVLPISVAGFGVREGAFVVVLAPFGVSAADATLLSLLAVVSVAIASLPGGIAIALGGRPSTGQEPEARLARQ